MSRGLLSASLLAGSCVVLAAISATVFSSQAGAIGILGPDPNDDTSANGFRYVVSDTSYVKIDKSFAKVFYTGAPQARTIVIQNANTCTDNQDLGASSKPNGANHTQYTVYKTNSSGNQAGQVASPVWGKIQHGGACGDLTVTIPASAWQASDAITDYDQKVYGAIIVADMRTGPMAGTQNSFRYRTPGGVVGLTPRGAQDSGYQQVGSDGTKYNKINLPLRTDCRQEGRAWKDIDIYDPDNGVPGIQNEKFWVKVRKVGSGYVTGQNNIRPHPTKGGAWTGNASDGFKPGSGSNRHYYLQVNWEPRAKYVVELWHVYGNNTLQVGVPYDTAAFALTCPPQEEPTGAVVSAICPAGETNAQRIRFTFSDPNGPTRARLKVGSWTSTAYTSSPQDLVLNGDARGLNFDSSTYPITLQVRDKFQGGALGDFKNVASGTSAICSPNGYTVDPRLSFTPPSVEVGGSVSGRTGYFSSFTMPTEHNPVGPGGRWQTRYFGPYIAYESRMWYDNGNERWDGEGPDKRLDEDVVTESQERGMTSPTNYRNLRNWARANLELEPRNDPRYKVCLSHKINRAWYTQQDRSVTYENQPPGDYDNDPDTPDTDPDGPGGSYYSTAWSPQPASLNKKDIPQTNYTPKVLCATIEKWASMEVQEGDIETGGVFPAQGASACNPSEDIRSLGVIGHDHAVAPTVRGSKAEYGIIAAGSIVDFGSNNRLARQSNSAVLDFANVGGLGNFYGTGSGLTTNCFADVFGAYPGDAASPLSADGASVSATASGQSHYAFSSSNRTLTINGGTLSPGTSRIIRVTDEGGGGNMVLINGDIRFSPGPYGRAADVPQFVLLVDGDIDVKVASSVREVSGLYVTRGSFFTCREADLDSWNINLDSTSPCRDRLVVNGAIIAGGQLLPYRTNADDATYAEPAELFRLRGDILISDYAQKLRRGNLDSISEIELPARF